jgi:hypothetical protein
MLEFREMVIDLGSPLWRATTCSPRRRSPSEARLRGYPVVDAPQHD